MKKLSVLMLTLVLVISLAVVLEANEVKEVQFFI